MLKKKHNIALALCEGALFALLSLILAFYMVFPWHFEPRYLTVVAYSSLGVMISAFASRVSAFDRVTIVAELGSRLKWAAIAIALMIGTLVALKLSGTVSRKWLFTIVALNFISALVFSSIAVALKRDRHDKKGALVVNMDSDPEAGNLIDRFTDVLAVNQNTEFVNFESINISSLSKYSAVYIVNAAEGDRDKTAELIEKSPVPVTLLLNPESFGVASFQAEIIGHFCAVVTTRVPGYQYGLKLKRILDFSAALLLLIILAPLFFGIAVAVRVDSPGGVLYRQKRVTTGGRLFQMIKFRTMLSDHEANGVQWGHAVAKPVTRMGAILRKYSLDELPQLVNVLTGDMSLVGPRPERSEFIDDFSNRIPKYMQKHLMPAGITGLAQIRGHRGDGDLVKRVALDIEYIENWSLLLDFYILFVTPYHAFFHHPREPGKC